MTSPSASFRGANTIGQPLDGPTMSLLWAVSGFITAIGLEKGEMDAATRSSCTEEGGFRLTRERERRDHGRLMLRL